jgi:hypothetical protein
MRTAGEDCNHVLLLLQACSSKNADLVGPSEMSLKSWSWRLQMRDARSKAKTRECRS